MLKAIILAGGRGIRLRPLTDAIPKPMVEIRGRPFLEYQLEQLKKYSITQILICAGYRKEKIIDYFGDGSRFNLKIEYSLEDDFLGTAGALKRAVNYLPEEFILLYGDSYLPIDYAELINFWFQSNLDFSGLVVCYENKIKITENNIYLDKKGIVREYHKRTPDKKMNYVEAGVLILKKEVLEIISQGEKISLEEEIFPILIKQKRLKGYPTAQRFYDIGTLKGLSELEGYFDDYFQNPTKD